MFSGAEGEALHSEISAKTGTFEVGSVSKKAKTSSGGLSKAEVEKIENAIKNAKSLEEVARLERMLKSGRIPDAHDS